ncbi:MULTISPECIES: hypothetical protein [unclassified Rhodococcus (in: high G+C Gram-positive bacteria)]|uniref:hypothetical protein n=1 Tax=unclassified Rhodococcus (in: high G+C Gram-positive bacteria) TaxID=192944 RepID=UPI0007BB3EDB|nr:MULTISPECIES: hypothetical protein [unclassified Rhodococcus (in: high G+C Gram-positive bacteria)]KZF08099.1 hypothetical protein A2J02_21315 [Rhodococcus sp. EPR-147]KZF09322.1 hypothetical protein A2J04_22015 [Rhodococcus sp. EPR-279]OZE39883.1 hypothetical protein CH256_06035 [Rhodococcus sp. 05-2254-6]
MSENLPRVETVVDDLYSLPPADFVSHRAAYVTRFKKAGDKAGATRIGALRKPTLVAWLVNTLARRDESALAELFDLGEQLERAQQCGDGPRLRELSTARSTSIRALTDRAVALGRDLGATVGDNAAREISNTLNAAMADAEIRDRVRKGRTVVAETYSGFGPALLSIVPDSPDDDDAAEDDPVSPEVEDDRHKTDEAERNRLLAELESAESDLDTARTEVDEAQADTERKASELHSAAEEVERIEAELEAAGAREQAAREAHEASVVQAESTAAALDAARIRVAEARSALDSLT